MKSEKKKFLSNLQALSSSFILKFSLIGLNFTLLNVTLVGCALFEKPPAQATLPVLETRLHQVSFPNESLSLIALWYTGEAKNWSLIRNYNGHIKSAGNLIKGDTVRIPSYLMVRLDPMSEAFVNEQLSIIKKNNKKISSRSTIKKATTDGTSQRLGSVGKSIGTADSGSTPSEPIDTEHMNEDNYVPDDFDDYPNEDSQDLLIENLLTE